MASLRFEGAIDGIKDKQMQFIRDVLHKRGFNDNKVLFKPVGKTGDNYVANVLRVTTIVEGGEDFKMIAKIAPDNEQLRKGMNTGLLFNNESIMYEEVLPKLVSLQIAADVAKKDLLRYAECYGCLTEEPNEVILLEDLSESNFGMLDRMSSLSNDAIKLILKNFALIHSLSFVLKKKEPETFQRFASKLEDMWGNMVEEFDLYMNKLEGDAIEMVDEQYKNYLRGTVSSMSSLAKNLKKTEKYSKNLVIQQGDGWTNNILFKLVDGTPKECIMIDYQISREANPMCDFLYMVLNCTDHALRSAHYFEWIDYYHNELDKSLSEYGMKANYVYPRDQLDADLRRYSKVFFAVAVMTNSAMCLTHEEAAVVKDSMKQEDVEIAEAIVGIKTLSIDTIKLYKSRVQGLIDSFRLFGYFL